MRRRIRSSSWLIFIMVCLVATTYSQSVPSVSFRVAPTYGAGSTPVSVAVGDFNGDGKPDLANSGSSNVSVLLGNGDGSFQAAGNYAAGPGPTSLAVGDFNGDGKLAVAGGSNVTILLNATGGSANAATSTTLISSLNPSM